MMHEFAKSRHLVFTCSASLSKGALKKKGSGRLSTHMFSGDAIEDHGRHEPTQCFAGQEISVSTIDSVNHRENIDISPKQVTKFTKHESPDVFEPASRYRLHTVREANYLWTSGDMDSKHVCVPYSHIPAVSPQQFRKPHQAAFVPSRARLEKSRIVSE